MEPFQKHLASIGELEGYASGLLDDAADAVDNTATTQNAYQPAVASWSGMGAPELQAAPTPLRNSANEAGTSLAWAGACAQIWAEQVRSFNTEVDRITGGLDALGTNWGATGTDGEPPTDTEVAEARSVAMSAARQQWSTAYNTYILDGEDRVVAMLNDGPTEEHLATASYYGGPVASVADALKDAVIGGVAARLATDLREHATWLRNRAGWHESQYLRPGTTPGDRAFHNNRAYQARVNAGSASLRAGQIARTVGARLPVIGLGITAAGIGYDVSQGKPVGQAVASGVGGAVAAMATGAAIGTMIPVPVVGTVVGAVVGLGVGLAVSGGIDWAFENAESIGNAVSAGADAIGDGAKAVADGAKGVWNSVFG